MKERLTLKWNSQGIEEEGSVDEDFLSELLVKDLFHPRSCPFQLVPISVVGTKMESGWGKWGYGPQTMMLSFFFSSLLHFWFSPRYLLCLLNSRIYLGENSTEIDWDLGATGFTLPATQRNQVRG